MPDKVEPMETDSEKKGDDPDKYGEAKKYDPTFNGPIKNRGCTDVICCILFVICILGMAVVGYYAYSKGDPKLLLYPSDSQGNLCGYGEYSDKPNLLFFDLIQCAKVGPAIVTNGCPTTQVCVKSCPTEYWTWYTQYGKEMVAALGQESQSVSATVREGRSKMYCNYSIDVFAAEYDSPAGLKRLVQDKYCASYYYPMEEVLGRCLPSFISEAVDKAQDLVATVDNQTTEIRNDENNTITIQSIFDGSGFVTILLEARDYGEKILQDVQNSKWFILFGLGLAMIVSFIWIVIMRWIAGFMVWFTILCFVGLFTFGCYYSYSTYYEMKNANSTSGAIIFTTDLSYYLTLKQTWLAFGCTSATLLLILLLIILILRKRIMIAIAIIKEGSRAIGMMMFTLIWPIWPFILQVGLIAYWGTCCIYLASTTNQVYEATNTTALNSTYSYSNDATTTASTNLIDAIPCDPNANNTGGVVCSFVKNDVAAYTTYLQIYMLFMLFWVMNWIIGFGQMVLAGAFASYYWAFDKDEHMPVFPVLGSLGRTLFYHTGSIAFGALLIAIIQIIRVALEYLDAKLKGKENEVAKFFLKCLKCCFWCLEKFMKMINKNAYILIAIYGKNFCTAAKDAFFLIMRNILRVAVVDKVTDFVLFIGKLVVVGAMAVLSFYFFNGTLGNYLTVLQEYQPELNYFFVPVFIIALGSYAIAACFFSVYGMAVDTLFLCFLEDLEMNDGSEEKPYFMSKELLSILGKKNVKETRED